MSKYALIGAAAQLGECRASWNRTGDNNVVVYRRHCADDDQLDGHPDGGDWGFDLQPPPHDCLDGVQADRRFL